MKRLGEYVVFVLAILNFPCLILVSLPQFYKDNSKKLWIFSLAIAIVLLIIQYDFFSFPKSKSILRTVRFYLYKTQVIATILFIQSIITLGILKFTNTPNYNETSTLICIDLMCLSLLIATGKLSNTDSQESIFHDLSNGHMHLYVNNGLRFIPDPPTFNLLGLSWGDAIDIDPKELQSYRQLSPITSIKDMKLYSYRNKVYGLVNEKLKHIPNETTLEFIKSERQKENKDNSITPLQKLDGFTIDKRSFSPCK